MSSEEEAPVSSEEVKNMALVRRFMEAQANANLDTLDELLAPDFVEFEVDRNPKTGKPYTNAEVARMTLGDLSEEDVERIRTGDVSDPTVGQVAALAGVFGVEPSYLMDRGEPLFDGELVEALRNRTIREATREISRLPEKERQLVLGIVWQFGSANNTSSRQNSGGTA
jgi:hypothetical protein